ncbi:MAG TPA: signal peptidase II [Anaeromyxobacteraceae bacterium]|nr:signal peptidase II [Anaeromyxobacteraceae bacterium]
MTRLPSKWALLAILFTVLVLADQWTKFLAVERLTTLFQDTRAASFAERVSAFYGQRHLERFATEPYYVMRPVWRMNYVENPGAAWGMFRSLSPGLRFGFFVVVYLAATVFILRYYHKAGEDQRFLQLALVLVLSGAIGNFIDRMTRRYVIDFVEWYWWNRPDIRWPTFNVADSLIVVGVAMLVLHPGVREPAGEEREEAPPAA